MDLISLHAQLGDFPVDFSCHRTIKNHHHHHCSDTAPQINRTCSGMDHLFGHISTHPPQTGFYGYSEIVFT